MTPQAMLEEALSSLTVYDEFAFDLETTSLDPFKAKILIVSVATEDGVWALSFEGPNALPYLETMEKLEVVFSDPDKIAITWNGGFDVKQLIVQGVNYHNKIADGMVARWLCDETLAQRKMLGLKKQVLINYNYEMVEIKDTNILDGVVDEEAEAYARDDALYTYKLWKEKIEPNLRKQGLEKVYWRICSPVVRVLADMELNGFFLDTDHLTDLEERLGDEVGELTTKIKALSGVDTFNPGSGKQISKLLFDDLGIEIKRGHPWTKSGYWGTAEDVLKRYKGDHTTAAGEDPVDLILRLRWGAKLLKTYVKPFLKRIDEGHDGRIRTGFRQTGTKTGRLSSAGPNLQNIPTEKNMIRRAFIAPPGKKLVVADYSQIELRVGGFLAAKRLGSSNIQAAYAKSKDADLHEITRMQMEALGVERFFKSDPNCRRNAKIVNFGFFYGRSAAAFSRENKIDLNESKDLRNKFLYDLYPEIPKMQKYCAGQISMRGFVTTIAGRRRRFFEDMGKSVEDIWWPAWVAWNSLCQGSSQDIIQIAMRNIYQALLNNRRDGLEFEGTFIPPEAWEAVLMLVQVHDELVAEAPEEYADPVAAWINHMMSTAVETPLMIFPAVAGIGHDWEGSKT